MSRIQRVFYTARPATPLDSRVASHLVGASASTTSSYMWVAFDGGSGLLQDRYTQVTISGSILYIEALYNGLGARTTPGEPVPSEGVMLLHYISEATPIIPGNVSIFDDTTTAFAKTTDTVSDYIVGSAGGSVYDRGPKQLRLNYRESVEGAEYAGFLGDAAVGVPAPVNKLQVLVTSPAAATDIDADSRSYVVTYINSIGQESAPSPPTAVIHTDETSVVTITIPGQDKILYSASPYGSNKINDYAPIVSMRVYRTNTGSSQTGFQLVQEVVAPVVDIGILDIATADLGDLLITDAWDVPPPVVTSGAKLASNVYVLGNDYDIYFSIPGVVYAFPVIFSQRIRDKVVHITDIGANGVILTSGSPYLIVGGSPDVMELIPLPSIHPCSNQKGVQVYKDMVIYPSFDGLIGVTSSGKVINLTENKYDGVRWRELIDPALAVSMLHDGVYYVISNTIGIAYHLKTGAVSPIDTSLFGGTLPVCTMFDQYANVLYTRDKSNVALRSWEPLGDVNHTVAAAFKWVSKELYTPDRSYGVLKVSGIFDASNSIQATIIIDGVSTAAGTFADSFETPLRLPAIRGAKYKVQLDTLLGAPEVHTVQLAVHARELM